ncbi:ABC-type transport auxiliary lipoprotein family protein [Caulobacter henricii]|uniref:ABC transporter n=1 Tax=Caulobacter henricii TaxID=69395 RepID=A0A0P0NYP3_9CAUL|nr:ABC-type transport auxiliary lipoprotein family protein [Caulobacter henricii]ALL12905.1 ABC transporter [Caulobacter henricii]
MNPIRSLSRAVALAAAAVALTGCITLLPEADPVGLYRFGVTPAPASKGEPSTLFGVFKTPTVFTRAAAGDRILTITQGEAAYIAGARWVSPASILFDEAVARAFEADAGRARLIGRGEVAKADLVLRLEVLSFEAVYVNGPKAAPEVLVQVRSVLSRNSDRTLVGDQVFEARVKASSNRVSTIVEAYDSATAKVLNELTDWVSASGASVK